MKSEHPMRSPDKESDQKALRQKLADLIQTMRSPKIESDQKLALLIQASKLLETMKDEDLLKKEDDEELDETLFWLSMIGRGLEEDYRKEKAHDKAAEAGNIANARFGPFYCRRLKYVHGIVFKHLWAPVRTEDVEELVQEVFLIAYRNLPTFRGESKPMSWLGGIAYYTVLDRNREHLKERGLLVSPPDAVEESQELMEELDVSPTVDPMRKVESMIAMLEAVDSLSEQRKRLIYLRIAGYSYEEIASSLEISVGTVRTSLNRARRLLRQWRQK